MKKITIFITAFLFVCNLVFAQDAKPAFYDDIQVFKRQDSINPPPKHAILFVGSSSFTKWTDVQDYFPKHSIINRGFGGSSLPDVMRYESTIIFPYEPKQIVIYCGENDFAASDVVTPELVFQRFQKLFIDIRDRFPNVAVAYISMKPSPSRVHLMPKFVAANQAIKNFLRKKKKTAFIDVYASMLNKDGSPIQSLFIEDNLHMNASGYKIWQRIIEPFLVKN